VSRDGITRRNALSGAASVGVGLPLLAACGGDDTSDPGGSSGETGNGGGSTGNGGSSTGGGGGEALTSTSDIPVGGGTVFPDDNVVVTQPTEGEFKAFSAVCTHQGCLVNNVDGGIINCICHESQFSIEDGSNTRGPSGSAAGSVAPLAEVAVTVDGDQISLA